MANELQVKDHLRSQILYRPVAEHSLSEGWKRKLLYRHAFQQQLTKALQERHSSFRLFFCISIPLICLTLAFAVCFGLVHPEHWFESIVRIINLHVPPIGLKETFLFIIVVNGLTLLIRRRAFFL